MLSLQDKIIYSQERLTCFNNIVVDKDTYKVPDNNTYPLNELVRDLDSQIFIYIVFVLLCLLLNARRTK